MKTARAVAGRLALWRANWAARRRLRIYALRDPRLARDIGLSDADLARAARTPFWGALCRADQTGWERRQ